MSRSINTGKTPNPAKRWFKWDSETKGFKFYDKDAEHPTDKTKKGANILVPLPFQFLVLDTLHTISGFSDAEGAGIYSNEIRDLKKQTLTVKIGKNVVASGLYEDLKGKVAGAKYAQAVYIGYFDAEKNLQIGNIKITGSALGSWIDFCKSHKPTEGAIKVVTSKFVEKNKKVNWNEPVFEAIAVKPPTEEKAIAADTILQAFLKEYFDNATLETTPVTHVDEVEAETKQPATDTLMDDSQNGPVTTAVTSTVDDDF